MTRGIFIVAYFSTGVVTAHFLSRVLDDAQRGKLQMTCVDVNEQALKGIISIAGFLNLFPAFLQQQRTRCSAMASNAAELHAYGPICSTHFLTTLASM